MEEEWEGGEGELDDDDCNDEDCNDDPKEKDFLSLHRLEQRRPSKE